GGGFMGSELAASLAMNGMQVSMLFPGEAIGGRIFPGELARFLNSYYQEKGVTVAPGQTAAALEERGSGVAIQTKSGREFVADAVIAGLGIEPNLELPRGAGLKVEDGV